MSILPKILYKLISITAIVIFSISATFVMAETDSYKITMGAKLYDNWMSVIDEDAPKKSHGLYPNDMAKADEPKTNWRCKECHGWDYRGAAGAYSSGSHYTGIIGVTNVQSKSLPSIVAVLKDSRHGYGDQLNDTELNYLALFLSKGQVDMTKFINSATKKVKGGNMNQGKLYYETVCVGCHGLEGKLPDDMKPFGAQMGNPWEVAHKILNGQPDEQMPALRELDRQVMLDIMSYLTTLPKE